MQKDPTEGRGMIYFSLLMAALGTSHLLITSESGDLYGLGAIDILLGTKRNPHDSAELEKIEGAQNVVKVAAARSHAACIDSSGHLLLFGNLNWATLICSLFHSPQPDVWFESVSCGQWGIIAVDCGGRMWGIGLNDHGQLGFSSKQFQATELTLIDSMEKPVLDACCGFYYSLCLTEDKGAYVFGSSSEISLYSNNEGISGIVLPTKLPIDNVDAISMTHFLSEGHIYDTNLYEMSCDPPLDRNANFDNVVTMYAGYGKVIGVEGDCTFRIDGIGSSIEIPDEFINVYKRGHRCRRNS